MVCTTRMSPITVITVVDVVGVIPNVHTSAGLPVLRQTSDSSASGLSGLPVITINFNPGFKLCASCVNSTISRVLPELEMSNSKSFSVGVQSPTEINAPRGCAVILRRICQLSLTRITHQVSRAFDLNKPGG